MCPSPRILIVDDSRLTRRLLELVLEEAGFVPIPAESAEAGLELAGRDPPDAIIVDQEMAGTKGADLVRALRLSGDPRLACVPAIGMSALASSESDLRAAGACDFVHKPFDEEEIIGAVLLALARAHRIEWGGPRRTQGDYARWDDERR